MITETERKPRALVIDDSAEQRQAALDTIDREKYDLVVVDGIEEAMFELGCIDEYKAGPPGQRHSTFGRHHSKVLGGGFDYILTDLHMPASMRSLGKPEHYDATLQPYGYPIMILALSAGMKGVGILTEGSHHDSPMDSIIDAGLDRDDSARDHRRSKEILTIGTTRVLIYTPYGPFLLRQEKVGERYMDIKNWSTLLTALETGVIP